MKRARRGMRSMVVAVAGCTIAATALSGLAGLSALSGAQAASLGPTVKLIAAQSKITVFEFGGRVFLDPGIYVASLTSALELRVARASHSKHMTIRQIIHLPDGSTLARPLPPTTLNGWQGLRNFLHVTVRNSSGTVVVSRQQTFCPNTYDPQRVSPDSPDTSPYPQVCAAIDPFQQGMVWGVERNWAVDSFERFGSVYRLSPGTYRLTATIGRTYARLFSIAARNATASVTVRVVKAPWCCGFAAARADRARGGMLSPAPVVPDLASPPNAVRPDLAALPSWGINTSHTRSGHDLLAFGATVWVGGNSPLDVEGFRINGSPTMQAYQYFWRDGQVVGRVRAGTMGFDSGSDHNHWHFRQFAQYRLLNSTKTLAVRSHKQGFCIAPTDPVNLLLPHAVWQPTFTGFGGACGSPAALWVREFMPVGWGDTYFQYVAGQSFNITKLRNGTYYIEVIANPLRVLRETTTRNDVSLRKVILGGTRGHRTVKVPAWHGIGREH